MSFLKNILGAFVELDNQKPEDTKELKPGENEQAAIIIEHHLLLLAVQPLMHQLLKLARPQPQMHLLPALKNILKS
jgi:hypothetical protein